MHTEDSPNTPAAGADLSVLLITLLKGVVYRDNDERLWSRLLDLRAQVRDYLAVLNLELVLDEAEGYAFLRNRPDTDDDSTKTRLPRLVARRPLSFPVSLMLALLRRKMIEFDAGGADTRLIMSRDEIVEMVRVFLPDGSNEARLVDQIDTTLNKVVDLGFLRKLKTEHSPGPGGVHFEVCRILKAWIDAEWLAGLDARLADYQSYLAGEPGTPAENTHE